MTIVKRDGATIIQADRDLIFDVGGQIKYLDTYWDDLRFPVSGINPAGQAAPPTVDTADGRLSFSATVENVVAIQVQMPHTWKAGSTICPHIHWSPTNTHTGNVKWQIKYKVANVNEAFPADWTTITTLSAGAGVADTHQIAGFDPDIPMPNKTFSCMILMLVSRLGADNQDTYNAACKMNEIDIHYEIEKIGTREQYAD